MVPSPGRSTTTSMLEMATVATYPLTTTSTVLAKGTMLPGTSMVMVKAQTVSHARCVRRTFRLLSDSTFSMRAEMWADVSDRGKWLLPSCQGFSGRGSAIKACSSVRTAQCGCMTSVGTPTCRATCGYGCHPHPHAGAPAPVEFSGPKYHGCVRVRVHTGAGDPTVRQGARTRTCCHLRVVKN